MRKFEKYVGNLSVVNQDGVDYIKSYDTLVAKIDYQEMKAEVLGYWSTTTSKHINYACSELGLVAVKK